MNWHRNKKDPIPVEAKLARVKADLATLQADTAQDEAKQGLARAQSIAERMAQIRAKNHFAHAIRHSMGGNP